MDNKLVKQQNLVHHLFLRHVYDKTNAQKLADYTKAQQDLTALKYSEAK